MSEMVLLPHNLDAERSVLGSIVIDNQVLALVQEILRESDFYREAHRKIFQVMEALSERATAIDEITLKEELNRLGHLEAVGGHAYIASLADGVPSTSHVEYYARIVNEKSKDRGGKIAIEALGHAIDARNGEGPGENRGNIEATADAAIEAITDMRRAREGESVKAEDLADILSRPAPHVPWAARGLIARGDIGIISGPGGVGKTWIALDLFLRLAHARTLFDRFEVCQPLRVAILDLESRPWETDQRLHRAAAGMDLEADRGRVQVIRRRLRLDRPQDRRQLLASLRQWDTEFLLVDSFRRAHGGNENQSETISGLFLDCLDAIRMELDCGIVLNDHTRKPTGESDLDSPDLALRGSTDKRNMADWHVGVESRQERLAIIPTKTRHNRLPEPFLVQIAGLSPDDPEDGPVRVLSLGALDRASDKVQDAILALLDDTRDAGLLRGEIVGRSGYSERATDDALRSLKGRGRVSKQSEGKQARYFICPQPQRPQTTAQAFEGAE